MAELISQDPEALQTISRFGLPLGVGEKSIDQVCHEHELDTTTFLTIINYNYKSAAVQQIPYEELSLPALMEYLKNTHAYFFEFSLPEIRQKLIESLNLAAGDSQMPILIIRFFDEWVSEINIHMAHENERLFPYIQSLLRGERPIAESIDKYEHQHSFVDDTHIATKLTELKNMIIKYYPAQNNLLNSALYDIFRTEQELSTHCSIEDNILLPAVKLLERRGFHTHAPKQVPETQSSELSDRERDVLVEVVKGHSNKEIADILCISVHTVITHRKNIAAKLDIHSTAGLTVYAILNKLVDIEAMKG